MGLSSSKYEKRFKELETAFYGLSEEVAKLRFAIKFPQPYEMGEQKTGKLKGMNVYLCKVIIDRDFCGQKTLQWRVEFLNKEGEKNHVFESETSFYSL